MNSKPRTVLHIISSMRRGGRERQLAIITKYSTGIDNRIVYYNECCDGYIEQYALQNVCHHCQEKGYWKRIGATLKLSKELGADVIVSWGNMESTIAMIVSYLTGLPFINFSVRHGIRSAKWGQYLRTIVLHLSRFVVANSRAGLRANNIRNGLVLYNGIESIKDLPEYKDKMLRRRTELPGINGVVMISVANLVPYKDYMTVLNSVKVLHEMGIDYTYLIIGEGPNRSTIEDQIALLHLSDRVRLLGRTIDVDKYYRLSDIMIHSSKGEGCSNAILEAMKNGLPVVATNVGGTSEIINDKCGILFEYRDTEALTEALINLIENPDLRHQMGLEAHKVAKERFSVEAMVNRYEEIVQTILYKHNKRKRNDVGDR